MKGHFRVGISGWTYPCWRKQFYPEDLPQSKELEYASHVLRTIEINGTFYSLQSPKSYERWYHSTPPGFVFSIKGSRYITHVKRLKDAKEPLKRFFHSGVLLLKEKLGPILWQLPPSFRYDRERLEDFFQRLPKDFSAAGGEGHRRLRYALEVRHESFVENEREFFSLLRRYRIALVCADAAPTGRSAGWPHFEARTASFAYARLHGGSILYTSGYTPRQLKHWAQVARKWSGRQHDVFIYFDNDAKVHAPSNAKELQKMLSH